MPIHKYCIGDVVHINKEIHIIHEIKLQWTDDKTIWFEYSTNKSAWHIEDEIKLLHTATPESLLQLCKDLGDDLDEEIL